MSYTKDDQLIFEAYCKKSGMKAAKKGSTDKKSKKKEAKTKMVKEHHNAEFDSNILNLRVKDLLDKMEVLDADLYRRVEEYLERNGAIGSGADVEGDDMQSGEFEDALNKTQTDYVDSEVSGESDLGAP